MDLLIIASEEKIYKMAKERVLITGAAGFLGSHLCDRFIKEGYHVIGMDNLITGDLRNIEHLVHLDSFEFSHHDVSKFVHWEDTFANVREHHPSVSLFNIRLLSLLYRAR